MSMRSNIVGACMVLVGLLAFPVVAEDTVAEEAESDPHANHRQMMKAKAEQKAQAAFLEIGDAQLITQDGETKSLSSDIVGDRLLISSTRPARQSARSYPLCSCRYRTSSATVSATKSCWSQYPSIHNATHPRASKTTQRNCERATGGCG